MTGPTMIICSTAGESSNLFDKYSLPELTNDLDLKSQEA
jgi:hypothetical protein